MDNSTITTISIRNFKGIEDLQLNAKKLNAIIGKCGSGKSSLLDAIRFALTGKAGKEVIRKGCREASVVLRFSDNSTIERIRRTSENRLLLLKIWTNIPIRNESIYKHFLLLYDVRISTV